MGYSLLSICILFGSMDRMDYIDYVATQGRVLELLLEMNGIYLDDLKEHSQLKETVKDLI